MMKKILIVDDDTGIRTVVRRYLTDSGLSVVATDNGSDGLLLVREARPDLVLVDAEMPGLDGHAVCRVIKNAATTRHIPVILMSGARFSDKDVLSGFEGGADDYVLKPFALSVLLARMRAVLRRCCAPHMERTLTKYGVVLDPAGRPVKANGKDIPLTRKEFDLLATLTSKAGRVLSIPFLLETVWGYDPANYNDPGTVEVHVSHLRKKLGPRLARRLVNIIGLGYKFQG